MPLENIILWLAGPALSGVCALILVQIKAQIAEAKIELIQKLDAYARRDDVEDLRGRILTLEARR